MLGSSTLQYLSDIFWSASFWLPPNVKWSDIDPQKGYANPRDLLLPIPLAAIFLCVRYICERYWFAPVGITLGIKNTKRTKAVPNAKLEAAYAGKKKLKHRELVALAKQLDWSERQVERWWRHRHAQDKPSTLVKFCESSWRWLYYTYSFIYGMYCLWDKPWLWDINECWYTYPYQKVTTDCWWYYMSSLAFYWSLAVSQFFDIKRKDFWQMFIHHIATISLMSFSWMCNLHRIGTLVLLVHDCADNLLEAAKLAKYANYQKLCDGLFIIFTITWIVSRLGVYPFWVIRSITHDAPVIVALFPAYYIFNSLLILLLGLHCIWTYFILKIAFKSLQAGQMEGDIRSSSSDDSLSEDLDHDSQVGSKNQNLVGNGTVTAATAVAASATTTAAD
ncbi:ceramide synthase 6 isoform X1 [Schistocerca nitens]|uniref:ceramide synthase 6 isoform X1 n=1 Tax=Schistocerca nitens TaxID=7011 RepID=UPI00211843AB|nr:ceramide synthase 6 isoform X1 [Schistocerca nitens]